MNKTRVVCKIREYIYDDEYNTYVKEIKRYFIWWTYDRSEAINVRKYWILKYLLLAIVEKRRNKKFRIRKFIDYEPKYHCF